MQSIKELRTSINKIYLKDLLFIVIGIVTMIFLSFFISSATANNDIYMQLLASKKIINNLDFSGVGGHPVGIAIISSILKLFGTDPLIILYYSQPFLVALCFGVLYKLLRTVLEYKVLFFILLSSMTSVVIIKIMNDVT